MTDRLQVIDLVTNGPLKAGMRRKRVQDLYDYMVSWRHQRLKAKSEQQQDPDVVLPPFSPPKPTVDVALKNLFSVEISDLRKDSYKQSLRACFVKASQMVDPETGKFRPYTDVKAGLLNTKLAGVASVDGDGTDLATAPRACLTDSISELEVVPSPNQRAPSEWSDNSDEECDSSEDESCAWLYQ